MSNNTLNTMLDKLERQGSQFKIIWPDIHRSLDEIDCLNILGIDE